MSRTQCLPILLSASLVMGFGLNAGAQSSARSAGAWVEHKDPAGFSVELPRGWEAEGAKDGHVLLHSADRSVFAVLQPFKLSEGGSAAEWIGPLVKHMNTLFPGARIAQERRINTQTDEAIAKVEYAANGRAGQANVLCFIDHGAGMFYAIGAPSDMFAAQKATLLKSLTSFRYGRTAGAERTPAAANGPLSYTRWKDPQEGAFTTEVPRGWHIIGGQYRFAPIDVRRQIDVLSPDKQIHVQNGDAQLTAFALPGPSSQMRGLHEGQAYAVNGITYTVMHFLDGAEFSREYTQLKVKKEHSDLEITGTKERPDVEEQVNRVLARQGATQNHVSVGETDFSYAQNGKTVEGACITATISVGQGIGEIWLAFPSVITAPANQMSKARDILSHMIVNAQDDPEWSAKQRQVTQQFTQMVMRNHELAMQQLRQQYEKFTHQLDENTRHFLNILNNEADVVNNQTGQTFKTVGGHNYYWQRGGTVIGTDTAHAPDINFQPLNQF